MIVRRDRRVNRGEPDESRGQMKAADYVLGALVGGVTLKSKTADPELVLPQRLA
jgi:hypothetical protein